MMMMMMMMTMMLMNYEGAPDALQLE